MGSNCLRSCCLLPLFSRRCYWLVRFLVVKAVVNASFVVFGIGSSSTFLIIFFTAGTFSERSCDKYRSSAGSIFASSCSRDSRSTSSRDSRSIFVHCILCRKNIFNNLIIIT